MNDACFEWCNFWAKFQSVELLVSVIFSVTQEKTVVDTQEKTEADLMVEVII